MEGQRPSAADRLRELSPGLMARLSPEARAVLGPALLRIEAKFDGRASAPMADAADADGDVITDGGGLISGANKAAAKLLGAHPDFLVGMPFPFFLAEHHWRAVYALLNRARAGQAEPVHGWRVRIRQDRRGTEAYALLTVAPIMAEAGPPGLCWVLRDGGAVAWAEHALEAERAFADTLLDAARAVVLVLDAEGRIVRANPFTEEASGMNGHDLLGREWASTLLPPEDRPAGRAAVLRAVQLADGGRVS